MPRDDLPELIEGIYAAAAGEQSWASVAERLRQVVAADTAALLWCDAAGPAVLGMLGFGADSQRRYVQHFHAHDPWAQSGWRIVEASRRSGTLRAAVLGPEIVAEDAFRRSEFYNDYGRSVGNFHLLGAMQPVDAAATLLIGLHRPERANPFGEEQRALLDALLPHLRRGLDLWSRLGVAAGTGAAAALDAIADGAVLVDGDLRVLHLNAAAEAMARRGAIRLVAEGSATRLVAPRREHQARLAILVRAVALGGEEGGGVPLRPPQGPAVAGMVMRLPTRLGPSAGARRATGRALVLLRDVSRPPTLAPHLVMDLFGLTPAEAAVALAAAAGETAEAIARERRASVNTVRAQIRAALAKCGAANLRELTRLLVRLDP